MEMRNKDLENAWAVQGIRQEKCAKLEEENKNLKKELELVRKNTRANVETLDLMYGENVDLKKENKELQRENIKLKAQIEKMSGIGLVSAAPTVILDD